MSSCGLSCKRPSGERRRQNELCGVSCKDIVPVRLGPHPTGFPGGSEVKASACNAGNLGSIPGLGRSPGEGNGNPLQYSCLENPMDGGAWWATVHWVTKSWTRLHFLLISFNLNYFLRSPISKHSHARVRASAYEGGTQTCNP